MLIIAELRNMKWDNHLIHVPKFIIKRFIVKTEKYNNE